jgi:hypothetical protein
MSCLSLPSVSKGHQPPGGGHAWRDFNWDDATEYVSAVTLGNWYPRQLLDAELSLLKFVLEG